MKKRFKWTVEFSVDALWVADGFTMTPERAHDMLALDLTYANFHEMGARIVKAPKPEDILEVQGYAPTDTARLEEIKSHPKLNAKSYWHSH